MKNKIASILKNSRKECNFSPEYVVEQLKLNGINIAVKTLYGYEAGRNNINADTFMFLCKIYNITSFDIFFDETSRSVEENNLYNSLNELGKAKADEYIIDLSENKKYTENRKTIADDITNELKQDARKNTINTK